MRQLPRHFPPLITRGNLIEVLVGCVGSFVLHTTGNPPPPRPPNYSHFQRSFLFLLKYPLSALPSAQPLCCPLHNLFTSICDTRCSALFGIATLVFDIVLP